ncbi:MAG: DUF4416 family protein [Candidatus Omnitrophota bacterium]
MPVKLIMGLISQNPNEFLQIEAALCRHYGEIDFRSRILPFDFTDYYAKEMGKHLKRRFIGFKRLTSPEKLARVKLTTNQIESRRSAAGRRRINIDPGYLTSAKLVLATTKDFSHRIYLKKGIFAEITLGFSRQSFRAFAWTYPDFRSKEYIAIFNQLRNIYLNQLKKRC